MPEDTDIIGKFLVRPIISMEGVDEEETAQLKQYLTEAEKFLEQFKWCTKILNSFYGDGIGNMYALFLFEIDNATCAEDSLLWVLVGDLPSAYLVTDRAPDPASAIETYISLFREWVAAVRNGDDLKDIIPARAAPTAEHADMLEWRMNFLQKDVLPFVSRHLTPPSIENDAS